MDAAIEFNGLQIANNPHFKSNKSNLSSDLAKRGDDTKFFSTRFVETKLQSIETQVKLDMQIERRQDLLKTQTQVEALIDDGKDQEALALLEQLRTGQEIIEKEKNQSQTKEQGRGSTSEKEILTKRKAEITKLQDKQKLLHSYNQVIDHLSLGLKHVKSLDADDKLEMLDTRLKVENERELLVKQINTESERIEAVTESINSNDLTKAASLLTEASQKFEPTLLNSTDPSNANAHQELLRQMALSSLIVSTHRITAFDFSPNDTKDRLSEAGLEAEKATKFKPSLSYHEKIDSEGKKQESRYRNLEQASQKASKTYQEYLNSEKPIASKEKKLKQAQAIKVTGGNNITTRSNMRKKLIQVSRAQAQLDQAKTKNKELKQKTQNEINDIRINQVSITEQERRLASAKQLHAIGKTSEALAVINGKKIEVKDKVKISFDIQDLKITDPKIAKLSDDHKDALVYRAALNNSVKAQKNNLTALVLASQEQEAMILDSSINATEREHILKTHNQTMVDIDMSTRQFDAMQQMQNHVTELMDQGKFNEINKLKNGEHGFEVTQSYGDDNLHSRLLSKEPKLTLEETKQDIETLNGILNSTENNLAKFQNAMINGAVKDAQDLAQLNPFVRSTLMGMDYLGDFEGDIAKNRDTQIAASKQAARAIKVLRNTKIEAQELIESGQVFEAREMLRQSLKFAQAEYDSGYSNMQNHFSKQRGELEKNIDTVLETGRKVGIMVVAAGVTISSMGTSSGITVPLLAGTAAGTGFGFTAELAISQTDTKNDLYDGLSNATEKLPGDMLTALESSLAVVGGGKARTGIEALARGHGKSKMTVTLGKAFARMSPRSQRLLASSASGMSSTSPGIMHDTIESAIRREEIKSSLTQSGKKAGLSPEQIQSKIDQELRAQKLDRKSIIRRNALALGSGAVSGSIGAEAGGIADGTRRQISKAAIHAAEETLNLGVAAAELLAQGIDPSSEQFSNMLLTNFAQAGISSASAKMQMGFASNKAKPDLEARANEVETRSEEAEVNNRDRDAEYDANDADAEIEVESGDDAADEIEAESGDDTAAEIETESGDDTAAEIETESGDAAADESNDLEELLARVEEIKRKKRKKKKTTIDPQQESMLSQKYQDSPEQFKIELNRTEAEIKSIKEQISSLSSQITATASDSNNLNQRYSELANAYQKLEIEEQKLQVMKRVNAIESKKNKSARKKEENEVKENNTESAELSQELLLERKEAEIQRKIEEINDNVAINQKEKILEILNDSDYSDTEKQIMVRKLINDSVQDLVDPQSNKLHPELKKLHKEYQELSFKADQDIQELAAQLAVTTGDLQRTFEFIDQLTKLRNEHPEPEVTNQVIENLEAIADIPGAEQYPEGIRNNSKDYTNNPNRFKGLVSEVERAALLARNQDLGMEVIELGQSNFAGKASLIDNDGNGFLDGSVKGQELQEQLLSSGHARVGKNGQLELVYDTKRNNLKVSIDLERGILVDSKKNPITLVLEDQAGSLKLREVEVDLHAKQSNGQEIYIESKLSFETFLLENMGAIRDSNNERVISHYELSSEATQMDTAMNLAKAHNKEMGIAFDTSKTLADNETSYSLYDSDGYGAKSKAALSSYLEHLQKLYPAEQGYPPVKIFDENMVDITSQFLEN